MVLRRKKSSPDGLDRRKLHVGTAGVIFSLIVLTITMVNVLVMHYHVHTAASAVGPAAFFKPDLSIRKNQSLYQEKQQRIQSEIAPAHQHPLDRLLSLLQKRWTLQGASRHISNNDRHTLTSLSSPFLMSPVLLDALKHNNTPETTTTECPLPPSTECEEATYSIVTVLRIPPRSTSHSSYQLRRLFANILHWLYDDATKHIFILVPLHAQPFLDANEMYGARLLAWDRQPKHAVHLVFANSFYSALEQMQQHYQQNEVSSRVLLWRRADERPPLHYLPRRNVAEGLTLWKQQSDGLVAWQQLHINVRSSISVSLGNNLTMATSSLEYQQRGNKTDAKVMDSFYVLPDWSGLFHHLNWLCYILDKRSRSALEQAWDWETGPWGVMLYLGHLTPTVYYTPKNQTRLTRLARAALQQAIVLFGDVPPQLAKNEANYSGINNSVCATT